MNGAARGTLPPGDPHHFHLTRRYAFNNADVILIVGTPFDFRMGYGKRLSQEATVVQIDMDYKTVGKNRDVSPRPRRRSRRDPDRRGQRRRGLAAKNARATARAGCSRCATRRRRPRRSACRASCVTTRRSIRCGSRTRSTSSSPRTRMYIGDGGDVVTFSGGVVQPARPRPVDGPGPARDPRRGRAVRDGARSWPGPDREVVCLFGDGAFSLTGWDFETMVRFDLPFIGVVGNNSYMNQIRYGQIQKYGEERGDIGNKLGDVHYDKFAQMLGGYGEEVREPKDIASRARARPRVGQAVADQRLDRPGRVRARDDEPDDVQVERGRPSDEKSSRRGPCPGHDPRPGRPRLHADAGLHGRRRHQGGAAGQG